MSTTVLVTTATDGTRLAVIQNNQIFDLDFFQPEDSSTLDSIYSGRVESVQTMGAFVDIGFPRPALLPHEKNFLKLQEGQRVIIQITREEMDDPGEELVQTIARKGCQVSRKITLASQGLIYHPHRAQVLLSGRITDPIQKERLNELGREMQGVTFRHASQKMNETELRQQYRDLCEQFHTLTTTPTTSKPILLQPGPTPLERLLRDKQEPEIETIVFDDPTMLLHAQKYCQVKNPALIPYLRIARLNELPLFEHFGVEDTWESLLSPLVPLPQGGNIVIESTACLTSIDVNKSTSNALDTNLQAIPIIAEQMRLRHLGGNIIIDFIGTDNIANARKKIAQTLQWAINDDPIPTYVYGWSPLGWLELRREHRRPSLPERLSRIRNM